MRKLSAVIIDTRGADSLIYVINNIIVNLPTATVVWFHGPETNITKVFQSVVDVRRIRLQKMAFEPPFTLATYNHMVTQESFYNKLEEDILIFQPDSCFESLSLHSLDEFQKFDYIGCPWENLPHWPWNNSVGNGGFSYRKKSAMIKCIQERPYHGRFNEDVYFGWDCRNLINVAPVKVARRFSYELEKQYDGAMGLHKVWAYMKPETKNAKELAALQ